MISVSACRMHFATTSADFKAVKHTKSLSNGKNLAMNVCGGCHYDHQTGSFSGKPMKDLPKIAGKVYAANLTHSKTHGKLDAYSDAEIAYLLRTGIGRDGRFIPYMLRPNMADDDINDLIVFLRSDDPVLAAVNTSPGETHLNMIGKMGMRMYIDPLPYRMGVAAPDESNPVAYGRYLVDNIGCYHCHSKKATSINYGNPEDTKGYMAGGAKAHADSGKVRGANLTFDEETGIGRFSRDDFRKSVQQAIGKDGVRLKPPMHPFPALTDQQADAIYAYLKTLPKVHHSIRQY